MSERKVAVITGGSAGVGRAAAQAFAGAGHAVALLARGEARLKEAVAEARALGVPALGIPVDVSDADQLEAAADRIERELGPIEVWVNNAMVTIFARVEQISADEFRRVTDVTYLGTVNGTQAALKRMRPRNRGCIVQVGSALAYRSIPLQSAYCGAKAAIRGFTDSVRSELIHDGSAIKITMVHLSAFNTPQFTWARNRMDSNAQPLPPIFQPEIAGEAIVRAASGSRREWWIGWPAVQAILSARAAPWIGDHVVASKAYEGQLTGEPVTRDRDGNLFEPVAGSQSAHGPFDDQAKTRSWQVLASRYRLAVALTAAVAAIATWIAL